MADDTPRARAVPRHRRRARRPAAARARPAAQRSRSRWRRRTSPAATWSTAATATRPGRRFEDALGALEGGRCLAFASGLAAVATVLDLVGHGRAGRRAAARLQRQRHAARRPRGARPAHGPSWSTSPTPTRSSRPATDAALVWLESPTNPALEVADIAPIAAAAHEAGAYVVVDNTFATPLLQRPLELGADIVRALGDQVPRRPQRRADGRGRHPRRRAVRRAQGPSRPGRRDPRPVRGVAGAARPAHPAPAASSARRPTPPSWPAGSPSTRRSARCATPASARSSRSCSPRARWPPTCSPTRPRLWVHATSLGGVESTFERRRRWKAEAATIPEGLVRLSVGIEDVEDLWADLVARRSTRPGLTRPTVATDASVGLGLGVAGDERRPSCRRRSSCRRRPRRRPRRSARRRPSRPASASSDAQDFAPSATWRVEA